MEDQLVESYFLRENIIDIDAAVVGIGQGRWVGIVQEQAIDESAAELMRANRFDVLPIVSEVGIREYYQTSRWNDYSSIERKIIEPEDAIPLRTHIREVIKGFATEHRLFYFLTHENKTVGLVSVANLNGRLVKVYLFDLLSELEVRLGEFIYWHNIPDHDLMPLMSGDMKKRYDEDQRKGLDLPVAEYLFLKDLINFIAKNRLFIPSLGYESRNKFDDDFGSLNELRHAVAHPTRSIITEVDSVKELWKKIEIIEKALFQLRQKSK